MSKKSRIQSRAARAGVAPESPPATSSIVPPALLERLASENPLEVLAAIRDLRPYLDALQELHVRHARRGGLISWSIIGCCLGVSAQAAQKRYG